MSLNSIDWRTCITIDQFTLALDEILKDVKSDTDEIVSNAAEKAARKGKNEVRKNARNTFDGTGKYAKSWDFKSGKKGQESYAEIGSTLPGLPHLLEKGHATLNGGRVPGRAHIAPAAEVTFRAFEDELKKGISEL